MRRVSRPDQLPVFTVDLGDGDWVKMKSRFTLADREAINEAIVSGSITTSSDGSSMGLGKLSLGASNTATLLRGIVEWNGPGFCRIDHDAEGAPVHDLEGKGSDCKIVNVAEDNIRNLDDATARMLLGELEKRNAQPVAPFTATGS